jgi:hypothetical protein
MLPPAINRPTKITFADMREQDVRGLAAALPWPEAKKNGELHND